MDLGLWQQEKALISELLVRRIIGQDDKETFTYDELLCRPLPEFLRLHIKTQARRFLQEEKPLSWSPSARYRFDEPEVREAIERVLGLLLLKTRFSRSEIKRWVELGVNFQVDILVRPRQALLSLFFRRQQVRRREEIVHTLEQLADGRPYLTAVAQLVMQGPEAIDAPTFEQLASKAEEQTYRSRPLASFMSDVAKLEDFLRLSGQTNSEVVRTEQLMSMLRERNLPDIAEGIGELAAARKASRWALAEIETALERQLLLRGLREEDNGSEGQPLQAANGGAEALRESRPDQLLLEAIHDARAAMGDGGLLEGLFTSSVPPQPRREPPPRRAAATRLSFAGVDEDRLVIDHATIERQPPGPYPPLRSLINNKERKIFMKKLFNNDRGAYHAFIDRLEAIERWKEAKGVIDAELARRQISPFCREAMRLGDLVFSRYFARRP